MKKVLIMKSNFYDALNEIYWSDELLKNLTVAIGNGYVFDDINKCVWYQYD